MYVKNLLILKGFVFVYLFWKFNAYNKGKIIFQIIILKNKKKNSLSFFFLYIGLNIAEFLENYGYLVPTLVGIKYSNTDLSEVAQALEARNGNYTILVGAEKVNYLLIFFLQIFIVKIIKIKYK